MDPAAVRRRDSSGRPRPPDLADRRVVVLFTAVLGLGAAVGLMDEQGIRLIEAANPNDRQATDDAHGG